MKSEPYYCPRCINEPGCGYHGILRFKGDPVPRCSHHTDNTVAPEAIDMVPVSRRKRGHTNQASG